MFTVTYFVLLTVNTAVADHKFVISLSQHFRNIILRLRYLEKLTTVHLNFVLRSTYNVRLSYSVPKIVLRSS